LEEIMAIMRRAVRKAVFPASYILLIISLFSSYGEAQEKKTLEQLLSRGKSEQIVTGEFMFRFAQNVPQPEIKIVDGIAITGIPSIDALNRKFKVSSIEGVFDNSHKIKKGLEKDIFGLARSYRCIVPKETDINSVIKQYKLDPHIENAWPKRLSTLEAEKEAVPGVFLVRFSLDTPQPAVKIVDGIAITGIPSIDTLNKKYKVGSIEKLFGKNNSGNDAGKKSREKDPFRIMRIYKFTLSSKEMDMQTVIRQYHMDPNVEMARLQYKTKKGSDIVDPFSKVKREKR
jgi:hypothetical protein